MEMKAFGVEHIICHSSHSLVCVWRFIIIIWWFNVNTEKFFLSFSDIHLLRHAPLISFSLTVAWICCHWNADILLHFDVINPSTLCIKFMTMMMMMQTIKHKRICVDVRRWKKATIKCTKDKMQMCKRTGLDLFVFGVPMPMKLSNLNMNSRRMASNFDSGSSFWARN